MPRAHRILVIEDSPVAARLLAEHLTVDCGITVDTANCFADARTILASGREYQVIIFDLGLPDNTGLERMTELRELAPEAAIIIYTAASIELQVEAIRLGAQDFIPKGAYSPQSLAERIDFSVLRHQAAAKARRECAPITAKAKAIEETLGKADELQAAKDSDPARKSLPPGSIRKESGT